MTQNGMTCLTVLVVDDFADSRFMLRAALEMKDFQVIEATNGQEAVETVKRSCPDLILMDLNMPEMDGLEATKEIRQCRELCERVRIVAVTAYNTYGMKEAAIEAGCDAYLAKPVDFNQLDKILLKVQTGW